MARTELLAHANKGVPWVPPVEGQEIEIPAVVTYMAGDGRDRQHHRGALLGRPEPRLGAQRVQPARRACSCGAARSSSSPMPGLRLTEAGRAEARAAAERDGASGGMALELQRKADAELPQLLADVRYGRYAEAVARGNRLLGGGALTHPQLAVVAPRAARGVRRPRRPRARPPAACAAWRSNEPNPALDPVRVSPKIRAACDAR